MAEVVFIAKALTFLGFCMLFVMISWFIKVMVPGERCLYTWRTLLADVVLYTVVYVCAYLVSTYVIN